MHRLVSRLRCTSSDDKRCGLTGQIFKNSWQIFSRFVRSLLDIFPPHTINHRGESTVPKWTYLYLARSRSMIQITPNPEGLLLVHSSVGLTLLNEFNSRCTATPIRDRRIGPSSWFRGGSVALAENEPIDRRRFTSADETPTRFPPYLTPL
jgi:hypothetical protein